MIIVKTIIHVEEAFENIQVKTYFNAFDFNFEFSLPWAARSNWFQTDMFEKIFYKQIFVKSINETKNKK